MRLTVGRRLAIGEHTWDVQVEGRWSYSPRRAERGLAPPRRHAFTLELGQLATTAVDALARARGLRDLGATLDGAPVQGLALVRAELRFLPDGGEGGGDFHFEAEAGPLPWPFDPTDAELRDALWAASQCEPGYVMRVDAMTRSERYFVFPVCHIGSCGVFVDRRDGTAHVMGSGLPEAQWLWGHERGVADQPADLVIEAVHDPAVLPLLHRIARVDRAELSSLPWVWPGAASWQAIPWLHEAGERITWSVRPVAR